MVVVAVLTHQGHVPALLSYSLESVLKEMRLTDTNRYHCLWRVVGISG